MRVSTETQDTSIEALSEGIYRARVKKITVQPARPGKEHPRLQVEFKLQVPPEQAAKALADGTYPLNDWLSLAPQAGWKLEEFLNATGIQFTSTDLGDRRKRIEFDTEAVAGAELMLVLSVSPEKDSSGQPKPNGRLRNQVESYSKV